MNKYKIIKIKGKNYVQHRLVMEKYLGRKLKPKEIVHHIENLELLPNQAEHFKLHMLKEGNHAYPKLNIDKDYLKELYLEHKSVYKVADILGWGKSSVHRRIQEYGIR